MPSRRAADFSHGCDGRGRDPEASFRCTINEQSHGLVSRDEVRDQVGASIGSGEWRDRNYVLARHPKRLPARCEDVYAGTALKQLLGQASRCVDDVLAVIEDKQKRPGSKVTQ